MGIEDTARARMLAGELYRGDDAALVADRNRAKALCAEYNKSAGNLDRRILAALLGYETDAWLEPPFFCDYGYNLHLGRNVYANHNRLHPGHHRRRRADRAQRRDLDGRAPG